MTIRPAQASDLDAMATIADECFGASAWRRNQFELGEPETGQRWTLVATATPPSPAACLGYLVMALALDEVELQALAVAPGWQNQGIGSALLRAGLAVAVQRGAERVFLEVRAGNLAAQRFYRRFEFREFARRPHYYHEPDETAVLMRWSRSGPENSGL